MRTGPIMHTIWDMFESGSLSIKKKLRLKENSFEEKIPDFTKIDRELTILKWKYFIILRSWGHFGCGPMNRIGRPSLTVPYLTNPVTLFVLAALTESTTKARNSRIIFMILWIKPRVCIWPGPRSAYKNLQKKTISKVNILFVKN